MKKRTCRGSILWLALTSHFLLDELSRRLSECGGCAQRCDLRSRLRLLRLQVLHESLQTEMSGRSHLKDEGGERRWNAVHG